MARRFLFLSVVGGFVCCGVSALVFSASEEKLGQSAAEQLERLQSRLAQLESRVAALEKRPPFVVPPDHAAARTPPQPLPKGWQPREFNGQTYYFVPLDGQTKARSR